jgi:phospholipid-binding lipoprotein MlaA
MKHGRAVLLILALCASSGCAASQTPQEDAHEPRPVAGEIAGVPNPGEAPVADPASAQASTQTSAQTSDDEVLDDSAFDDATPDSNERIADPLEPWNRMWFAFNDFTYMNIIKPVYKGYAFVVPEMLRAGLSNAHRNLKAPIRIANSILQLEFPQAVVEFGRFVVNTAAGGAGLAEIVKPEAALVPINLAAADFNGTLAKWGMGEGAYIVWPILGPSTVRDTIGMGGDMVAGISFWITKPVGPVENMIGYCVSYGLGFNNFGAVLGSYETLTKMAIEPYASLRDAYVKLRRKDDPRPGRAADPPRVDIDLGTLPTPSK